MDKSWDIFCTVIDNWGDAGVCWRLARQIAAERGEPVRLWIDDLAPLALLRPGADPQAGSQWLDGVEVRRWAAPFPEVAPHAVVIEAFACDPPESFLAAMAARTPRPVWLNLEYLSAEAWVEGCHALGSKHPRLPLRRWFFFPGFTAATGGLLRERGLPARREAERAAQAGDAAELAVSLFCYDNPALPALLDAWRDGPPLTLRVTEGKARTQVERWLGEPFGPGATARRGALTLSALPFLDQDGYDRLLWRCDLDFVRGEDSFVRAQWAARAFVWHIYPQDDDAHQAKLDAFLKRYLAGLPAGPAAALNDFWQAWNRGDGPATVAAWPALRAALPALEAHARRWAAELAGQPDLLAQIVEFVDEKRGEA
ncbi:elongation factor P maturation arginine rhamnosyltransferase EarP [Chitinimonas koreensis]|uniref:elongation factor P maturation arginine rhamnosyltransferase EarP n=1 Tax=Chitinimonas koreensis TaxID=356302 RepID=UPI00041A3149|nr:elongation factor P maturation arginine rhamnosyltransferase EarP [Chitinimonas koreensis]QNM94786.1 elongation factor P maturation arginine rhamnosyltransferase EarP [Chitinimonas koreensis]